MFTSFSDSLELVKENFRILKKDKEMILFPIISGITIILLIGFIVGFFAVLLITNPFNVEKTSNIYMPFFFAGGLVSYILIYFVAGFFNAGLINCALIRLNGGDPTFMDGYRSAVKNIKKIFVWSLIAGTVGYFLRRATKRSGGFLQIIGIISSIAWSLLTFFMIPVLIFEDLGIKESIKRSGELFKKTWGENAIGQASLVTFFGVGMLIFILLPVLIFAFIEQSIPKGSAIRYGLFSYEIISFVILLIIAKSLQGIYTAVLYYYATTGKIPSDYNPGFVTNAFSA